jgi:prolyl oligopeptidase
MHGVVVHDPYRWLEDAATPATKSWSRAEEELTRHTLAALPVRRELVQRLEELNNLNYLHALGMGGGALVFQRRGRNEEREALMVRAAGAAETVLLDTNLWPADEARSISGRFASAPSVSPDGRYVALSVVDATDMSTVVRTIRIASATPADSVSEVSEESPISWASDSRGFYYRWSPRGVHGNEALARAEVRLHSIGSTGLDPTIRKATGDPQVSESVTATPDGKWLLLRRETGDSEVHYAFSAVGDASQAWTALPLEGPGHTLVLEADDHLYVQTTEGAGRGHIFVVDPHRPGKHNWVEIVPERKDAAIRRTYIAGGHLLIRWLRGVETVLEIRNLDGTGAHEVRLPKLASAWEIVTDSIGDHVYFLLTTFVTPQEIYHLSIASGEVQAVERSHSSARPEDYDVDELSYVSRDGTRGPLFVVHSKKSKPDGTAPAIILGYGGFRSSMYPYADLGINAWLERGGVYAYVATRGGEEFGEDWYRQGTRTAKQHVFDDFAAASEALLRSGWTRRDLLVARGESNGGLLVAAVAVQHPDLFKAVLCEVPLTDMIRFPLFGDGASWVSEYGSISDAAEFSALLHYSPYHNVQEGVPYPAILVTTPETDSVVDSLHARKFVAALQHASTGGPVLLDVARQNHAVASRVNTIEADADAFTFALWQVGRAAPAGP